MKIALPLTLLFAAIIAFGTLSPPGPAGPPLPLSDKQLHFLAFALLVLPIGCLSPNWLRWAAVVALAYGGVIELIQPLVGRNCEWADLVADAGGIATVLILAFLRTRWQRRPNLR